LVPRKVKTPKKYGGFEFAAHQGDARAKYN
jgi:hypothetical protein